MNAAQKYAALTAVVAGVAAGVGGSFQHGGMLPWLLLAVTSGVSLGLLMASLRRRA